MSKRGAVAALGFALVLLGGAGCGDESAKDADGTATDPPHSTRTPEPADPSSSDGSLAVGARVEPGVAQVVTASNVVDRVEHRATDISAPQGRDAYVARLDPEIGGQVAGAAAGVQISDRSSLYAAVVAVGCQVPTRVDYELSGNEVAVSASVSDAGGASKGEVQCLVPMTSVALFLVTS